MMYAVDQFLAGVYRGTMYFSDVTLAGQFGQRRLYETDPLTAARFVDHFVIRMICEAHETKFHPHTTISGLKCNCPPKRKAVAGIPEALFTQWYAVAKIKERKYTITEFNSYNGIITVREYEQIPQVTRSFYKDDVEYLFTNIDGKIYGFQKDKVNGDE